MDMPTAELSHSSPGRLRLKVREKVGDHAYFVQVKDAMLKDEAAQRIETNAMTGSILFLGLHKSYESILHAANSKGLFQVGEAKQEHSSFSKEIQNRIAGLNRTLNRYSQGEFDFKSLIFLMLVGTGIFQLARGNVTIPPWYSAFWYALGLYGQETLEEEIIETPPD